MTNSKSETETVNPGNNELEDIHSDASLKTSASDAQTGPDDAVSQEVRREALRNAARGDQFVVASDLEDHEQREAAPGTREQD